MNKIILNDAILIEYFYYYKTDHDHLFILHFFKDIFHIGPITFETGSSYDCVEQSGWSGESTWSLSQASAVKYTLSYTGLLNTEGKYDNFSNKIEFL